MAFSKIPGKGTQFSSTLDTVTNTIVSGALALPTGTTAERPANPSNGYMRYNTTNKEIEVYYSATSTWVADFSGGITAVGGTESTITENGVAYKVHTFTSSGNFVVTRGGPNVEYLVVGGGGSGSSLHTGQGAKAGGGASSTESSTTVTTNTYSIVIGAGGAGWTSYNDGNSSSAFGTTAAGGSWGTNNRSADGNDGTYYSKFTNEGTDANNVDGGGGYFGGEGGDNGANQGDGYAYRGGAGGGGKGHYNGVGTGSGQSGYANSGGGGGAGNSDYTASGSGGSGVVVIRYPI